jgi:hypothetical protein
MAGIGNSIMARKFENLKFRLDITLHEVEFFPNYGSIFLLKKALENGYNLSNKSLPICLSI